MKGCLTAIISFVAVIIIVFAIAIPVSNNIAAYNIAKELSDIKLPDKTEYVESVSVAGKVIGNGNGMQYLGAILIKSELELEELQTYYSQFAENDWECIVKEQKGNKVQIVDHRNPKFQTEIVGDDYFVVYSTDGSDSIWADFDIRGH